ncbi:hypothetical protein [Pelagibius sp.]|uniref:hypothetical protein n=1 Tax=Pelagibius sp. TaxID=1931238 RepID=UPI00262C5DB0|nr:hypothetical protein [Pelagibius sp.]
MSPDRRALYEELVVWLAIRMTQVIVDLPREHHRPCEDGVRTKGCVVEHGFLSAFEAACAVLHGAGVAAPSTHSGAEATGKGEAGAYYQLLHDVPEIRAHLRRNLKTSARQLSEAVGAFLRVTTEFHDMPTTRYAFAVPKGYGPIFTLMINCGYLERVGDDVKWSSRVAPQMRAIYAWDKEANSDEDLYEARTAAEMEKMWATLPLKVQRAFFSGGAVDVVSLAIVIERFWIEGEWRYIDDIAPKSKVRFQQRDSLRKARDLAQRYEKSKG